MVICDLCGLAKACSQKEIEGKEYDICAECWKPIGEKLKGKGRKRETVFLPPLVVPAAKPEPEEPKPKPGEPPKIWGGPKAC